MFRLGAQKRIKPVPRVERAGAAVGRRVDRLSPKIADSWHHARDSAGTAGSEARARSKNAFYALKGDLRVAEPVSHRKRNVALALGAVGAAATAAYMTRRRRHPEWLTADITPGSTARTPDLKTPQARTSPSMPARSHIAGRAGDRAGATPDEMVSDAAQSVAGGVGKSAETTHRLRAQ